MASSPFSTRAACDRCHHKKVRCVSTLYQNECDRCAEHKVSCVFSPPGRNGRPPRTREAADGPLHWVQSASGSCRLMEKTSDDVGSTLHITHPVCADSDPWSSLSSTPPLEVDTISDNLEPVWADTGNLPFGQPEQLLHFDCSSGDVGQSSVQKTPNLVTNRICSPSSPSAEGSAGTSETRTDRNILRSLHEFQAGLYAENHACSHPISAASSAVSPQSAFDIADALRSMDGQHNTVRQHLDALFGAGQDSTCNFGIAMTITTMLGNAAETYEKLALYSGVVRHVAESYRPPVSQNHAESLPPMIHIGVYTPPADLTPRIIAVVLLHQLSVCRQLLNRLYKHLLHTTVQSDQMACNFFTTDLRLIVTQLLDNIGTRLARLEEGVTSE